ncbi:transposase [Arthrobacter sp. PAMC 25486]|uniref:transposase n=1 Tax=Arthrobacter sp. PAMC 25486 TaxID=1494608 RepID=UPI0012FF16C4|nr:transposase [Arthrobacter sp. PAMC 25486]
MIDLREKGQKANRQRKVTPDGRPVNYDKEAYKGRNVVKRSLSTIKQWRPLTTCHEKLLLTYRSAAVMHAVVIWAPR